MILQTPRAVQPSSGRSSAVSVPWATSAVSLHLVGSGQLWVDGFRGHLPVMLLIDRARLVWERNTQGSLNGCPLPLAQCTPCIEGMLVSLGSQRAGGLLRFGWQMSWGHILPSTCQACSLERFLIVLI